MQKHICLLLKWSRAQLRWAVVIFWFSVLFWKWYTGILYSIFYIFYTTKKSERVIKCTLSTRLIMSALMVISNLSLITAGLYWNIKIMQCDLCQNQLFSEQWLVFTLNDLLCGMLSSLKYVTGRFKFLLLVKTTLKSFLYKFLGLLEQVWGEIVSTLHPPLGPQGMKFKPLASFSDIMQVVPPWSKYNLRSLKTR